MKENKWYVVTKDVRMAERGRRTTSVKEVQIKEESSLRCRKASAEEIAGRKRDSNRTTPYKVLVEKGRVVL